MTFNAYHNCVPSERISWILTSYMEGGDERARADAEPVLRVLEDSIGITPGALDGFEIRDASPQQHDETMCLRRGRPTATNPHTKMLLLVLSGTLKLSSKNARSELLPGDAAYMERSRTLDIITSADSIKTTHVLVCKFI